MSETATVLVTCPDARGVIAAVTGALAEAGRNVLDADQHADPATGRFFMRLAFEAAPDEPEPERVELVERLERVVRGFSGRVSVRWPGPPRRMAVLCGRETHCVSDLLWRASIGEFDAEIVLVISNHPDAAPLVEPFGVPFEVMPIGPGARAAQEARWLASVEAAGAEVVALARYMQVLSPAATSRLSGRVINIHHSFLPAFAGAKPYHRAFEKGVKLIGATAHYVTDELDEGPIIAQQTRPVSHRDTVEDMIRKGRELERAVLAEAVRLHLDDRLIVDGQKTIVFD